MEKNIQVSSKATTATKTARRPKVSKTNVTVGIRALREGERISLETFLKQASSRTVNNLKTLEQKFGIKWDDVVKPPRKSWMSSDPFVVRGKVNDVLVKYDREQQILTVGTKRIVVNRAKEMSKKQFSKLLPVA